MEIGDYIASDNRRAAGRYLVSLQSECVGLARMPTRFPLAFDIDPPVRQRIHGRHYIFYSVRADHILIERVLDSARDISTAMFKR